MEFPQATVRPTYAVKESENALLRSVFSWMAGGLLLTAMVSWFLMANPTILYTILSNTLLFYLLIGGELALVIYLSARIEKLSAATAAGAFLFYSALNGVTLTPLIFMATQTAPGSVGTAFIVTAALFGSMAILGYTTKRDLSSIGSFAIMGVIGLIVASIVNIFLQSSMMSFIISVIGVIAFTLLTAYDVQKIKNYSTGVTEGTAAFRRASIMGALALYLDAINLFIYVLSLLSRRD